MADLIPPQDRPPLWWMTGSRYTARMIWCWMKLVDSSLRSACSSAPNEVLYPQSSGVYRVDPHGAVARIIGDAGTPNGIAISPDQRTLYVGSNRFDVLGNKAILAYDRT